MPPQRLKASDRSVTTSAGRYKVINGCSDLFVEVFGEQHARSAIGVGSLPFGITVEIEAVVEVK